MLSLYESLTMFGYGVVHIKREALGEVGCLYFNEGYTWTEFACCTDNGSNISPTHAAVAFFFLPFYEFQHFQSGQTGCRLLCHSAKHRCRNKHWEHA